MAYQVLYRKWRPRTFEEVYGQPTVTAALKNELKTGHLAHAYLFTGSRGTGKTSCAKILAKAVNCLSPVDGEPCNACDMCRAVDSGAAVDVTEIDAAANNGVDSIRELREEVGFTPVAAKYRVYIIDEVHELSPSAFNALLKTLEEPPAYVIFILATTEVHKLPATILSRCQRFDFGRIPPEEIASRMQEIAKEEQFSLTDEAALLLARLADGALRDALSLLDQCLSRSRAVDADVVSEATGMAGRDPLYALAKAIREQNSADALEWIDRLHNASKDMERLCTEMIDFFRSLMIVKCVAKPEELIVAAPAEIARLTQEAALWELTAILHTLTALQQTLDRIRGGVSRRVEMEMALIRLCTPALDTGAESLLRRVKALEDAFRAGLPAASADPAPPVPVAVAEKPKCADSLPQADDNALPPAPDDVPLPSVPAESPEEPFPAWADVLDTLRETCPPLFGVLAGSRAVCRPAEKRLLIDTNNAALFRELVQTADNKRALQAAIRSATGQSYRVGLPRSSASAPADDDPLAAFIRESQQKGISLEVK